MDDLEIRVRIWPAVELPRTSPHGPDVEGTVRRPVCGSNLDDQEANAMRLAEQMVRELFARLRAQRAT